MKKVFFTISTILLLGIIYIAIANINNIQPINYAPANAHTTMTNIALYTAAILISGLFTGAGIVYMFLSAAKIKVKAYERELERSSITGQNNASKVDVLEAKIKTLEKAFNTVIDERTKLEVEIKSLNSEIEKLRG